MGYRTRRVQLLIAAIVVGVIFGATSAVVYAVHVGSRSDARGGDRPSSSATATSAPTSSGPTTPPQRGDVDSVALHEALGRMRQLPLPTARASLPLITGNATAQPDVFASEFVRRLLTQDYATPRASLLAWVRAESTPTADPLVVGLVPTELRDRFALYSVTDTTDGPAPIPSEADWATLARAHGSTTVRVDRVIEPTAWSDAVEAGRVTDPGTTARLVAATVTRHTTVSGHRSTETFSVAVALNIEGPPTRHDWRFVAVVTYTSLPMGGAS